MWSNDRSRAESVSCSNIQKCQEQTQKALLLETQKAAGNLRWGAGESVPGLNPSSSSAWASCGGYNKSLHTGWHNTSSRSPGGRTSEIRVWAGPRSLQRLQGRVSPCLFWLPMAVCHPSPSWAGGCVAQLCLCLRVAISPPGQGLFFFISALSGPM